MAYRINEAGATQCIGDYVENGTYGGQPKYQNTTNTVVLRWNDVQMRTEIYEESNSTLWYINSGNAPHPAVGDTNWSGWWGGPPTPVVLEGTAGGGIPPRRRRSSYMNL